jgi:GTP-binding protein EngB required for normal cell division
MERILDHQQEELLKRTREVLGRLRDVLTEAAILPAEREALANSIRQLDELFLLVVAGEFNAGKSAFINALLGQRLLQEGVTPTTSQIHLLKYGPEPENRPVANGVWVQTAPVELLRNIHIVDTPGTNAILREHEALTAEFIPRSDLVLFITSADRPFTESERAFLEQIRGWGKKIVLIINKVDIFSYESEVNQVIDFVRSAAQKLLGDIPAIFPVSSRLAMKVKAGAAESHLWEDSGFEALETFIHETLDDQRRFRLKLLNPLGVGHRLLTAQLHSTSADLDALQSDTRLLEDIRSQTVYYNEDMQRNFKARLGEIDNILYEMEARGRTFFDDTLRLGRVLDLALNPGQIKKAFEVQVVADTPQRIEDRIGELIDWLVEQDLRQWTAVADHLAKRRKEEDERIVGQAGPREGTLAYDRQRLVDSIGKATRQAVATFDKERESAELAESARAAVAGTALVEIGGLGLGAIVAAITSAAWIDFTGIAAGVTIMALGFLIIPARRRRANRELEAKLADLRQRLMSALSEQFDREMRRSLQRIEDTISPFARFVRSERVKIEERREHLLEIEAHIDTLRRELEVEA